MTNKSPDRNELKNYLKNNIDPVIEPLVVAILKSRPTDIWDFSIKYLQDNKPKAEEKPASRAPSQQQEVRPVTPAQLNKPTTPIQTEKAEFYAEQVKEAEPAEVQVRELPEESQAKISQQADAGSDLEEEDEDVGDLQEIDTLKNQKKGSRASVSAEVYGRFNKKEDFVARVIEKTPEQKQKIIEKLSKAFMFASLEDKEKDIVIDAMEVKHVKAGDQIISQGDDGAELYIVGEGELDCFKRFKPDEEEKHLKVYQPGESFGELALLYNAPRAASIKAKTDAELYALDRATFNNIVKDAEVKRRERFEAILAKIELLESMDPYERSKVSDVANVVNVKSGEVIIKQGDAGDKFYFVEEGTAAATKVLEGKEEPETVLEYKSGDYFGELALLKDEPRAANVIATSDVKLLALEREAFNRVLGPLVDILKRNAEKYEKFK